MSPQSRPSIGGYTLERKLGHGGQGIVWQAARDGRLVALKIIDTGYDDDVAEDLRTRLQREMDSLRRVTHPAVIGVVGAGEDGGRLYAAYELIDGPNVYVALRAPSPPSLDDCDAFVSTICTGLDVVHSHGIIHRDIKPGNVSLRGDSWSSPVLLDFGLLRRLKDEQPHTNPTVTGVAVGTDRYIAPEVLADPRAFSKRSDQWSLARVVLEVLTVALRYDVSDFSTHAEMLDVCSEDDEAPHASQVLVRALGSPAERFESLGAFATAFRDALVLDNRIAPPMPAATPLSRDVPSSSRRPGETVVQYLQRLGCSIVTDYRSSGGALWFRGDPDLLKGLQQQGRPLSVFFAKGGGKATGHAPAWWTKDQG